ncbi:MAG: phosphoadenosine phosphosulfate reductase family protein [Thermodesulfobacteriota bacterium]|nr:phosphoadenosine phosphosulfate reductase family protein [Thermodesulfobacteriota bacterium]
MARADQDTLMALPLDEKIAYAKGIIREALEKFGTDKLLIAWTGGKDSTTMLWLYREVCKELDIEKPRCMFIDEGHVFEEILELVGQVKKAWDVNVITVKNIDVSDKAAKVGDMIRVADLNARNRQEVARLGYTEETFSFDPESYVGNHLMKTVAMNMFLESDKVAALSTGIRWDEQEARLDEDFFSPRSNPDHVRIHPILHFKERDIWDTIHKYKIPFCSLYYQGYRSLGAKGSTVKVSDIPAWEQDLENTTERGGRKQGKEDIMAKLRDLGYM